MKDALKLALTSGITGNSVILRILQKLLIFIVNKLSVTRSKTGNSP